MMNKQIFVYILIGMTKLVCLGLFLINNDSLCPGDTQVLDKPGQLVILIPVGRHSLNYLHLSFTFQFNIIVLHIFLLLSSNLELCVVPEVEGHWVSLFFKLLQLPPVLWLVPLMQRVKKRSENFFIFKKVLLGRFRLKSSPL